MKKLVFACFLASFFLFRPHFLQSNGMMYGYGVGDDYNYFAHASALVCGQFPSYQKECFHQGHSIGPALLASPFIWLFSFLDRLEGSSIIDHRTPDNIIGSWSQFGFFFASVFYFCLGCLLLFKSVKLYVSPKQAAWAVILMVICQGMPLFAFRRPVFSHSFEFFLQALLVFLFLRNEFNRGEWFKSWSSWVFLGIAAAMVFLTRYNNLLFALVWPWFFIARHCPANESMILVICRRCTYVFVPFILLAICFKWWPEVYNHYSPYEPILANVQLTVENVFNRILHVIFGLDWGLVFTAPFIFMGFAGFWLWKSPLKKTYIGVCLPLIVNLGAMIFFGSQGGWYGYRYFIASAFPLLVLPLAIVLDWSAQRKSLLLTGAIVMLALLPLVSMITFETTPQINLNISMQDFNKEDWSNKHYQIFAWQTVLDLPAYWVNLLQAGPLYFYYLYTKIMSWWELLNTRHIIYISYPDLKIWVQVMLIYLIPFALGCFFKDPKVSPEKSA